MSTKSILEIAKTNLVLNHLFRANATIMFAESQMMELHNPVMLKTAAKIAELKAGIRCNLFVAEAAGTEALRGMIWTDNSYDGDANNIRRSYEQLRDGVACINDDLENKSEGTLNIRQAACEIKPALMNYAISLGYTDYMMIESAIIEFNGRYEGSKL